MLKSCVTSSFHGSYLTHRLRAGGSEGVQAACPRGRQNLLPYGLHAQQAHGTVQTAIGATRHDHLACANRVHSRRGSVTAAATSVATSLPEPHGAGDAPESQSTPWIQDIFGGMPVAIDPCWFAGCIVFCCFQCSASFLWRCSLYHHGQLFLMKMWRILCCLLCSLSYCPETGI